MGPLSPPYTATLSLCSLACDGAAPDVPTLVLTCHRASPKENPGLPAAIQHHSNAQRNSMTCTSVPMRPVGSCLSACWQLPQGLAQLN